MSQITQHMVEDLTCKNAVSGNFYTFAMSVNLDQCQILDQVQCPWSVGPTLDNLAPGKLNIEKQVIFLY